jgi:Na+-driven multidrug efflux pump
MAATPIVGQALGAKKPEIAHRVIRMSVLLIALGLLAPVVFVIWKGHIVAQWFTRDAAVAAEAAKFFLIVPLSSYGFGVIMVLMAAFYGSGHTKPAMYLSLLRIWMLRLPSAWFLSRVLGYDSKGVYAGMVIGNIIAAVLTLWVFLRGNWQKTIVDDLPAKDEPPASVRPQ